jgi:hypothetical protein
MLARKATSNTLPFMGFTIFARIVLGLLGLSFAGMRRGRAPQRHFYG